MIRIKSPIIFNIACSHLSIVPLKAYQLKLAKSAYICLEHFTNDLLPLIFLVTNFALAKTNAQA